MRHRLNKNRSLLAATVAAACCFLAPSASAQGVAEYVPNRPTFSPYLGYFQVNTSGVPNYYAFVRPQQQLEQMAQRQAYQARTARAQFSQQQAGRIQLRATPATTGLEVREDPTAQRSTAAGFMNYSHYYQSQPVRRRPR